MTLNHETFESMQEALRLINDQNEKGRLVNLFQHGVNNIRGTENKSVYGCVIRVGEPGKGFGFGSSGGQTMLEAVQNAITSFEKYGEMKAPPKGEFKRGQTKSRPKADILGDFGLN